MDHVGDPSGRAGDAGAAAAKATNLVVTFVFTDIEGSTALIRALGDEVYEQLLEQHRAILRAATSDGMELRTEGDGMFFAFESADAAVDACLDAQAALSHAAWPGDVAVRVRMGVHTGPATPTADGYFVGLSLHQAARVVAAANGGQVLVSSFTAADFRGPRETLLDLGAFALRDFDEPPHLYQARRADLERVPTPPRAAPAVVHNLPAPRTDFVGRDELVDDLVKRLPTVGLLTLTGPGGIGKTRLAAQIGRLVAGEFPDGVWLVDLAAGDGSVVSRVAAVLGVNREPGVDLLASLVSSVRDRRILILLDNCEHVLDAAAEVVDALLAGAPDAVVLATSQEPFSLAAEWVVVVEPLGVPAERASSAAIRESDAVRLFAGRAAQARAGFTLDAEIESTVAELCRRLDGVPLALELAAGLVGSTDVRDLNDDLASFFDALRRRGGDVRHRSLDAAVDWSYQRLGPDERRLLDRMSVFRGPATEEHIAVVSGLGDIVSALRRLVHRSLVEEAREEAPPRYRLLEPIRLFAARQLADTDVHRRLLEWALALAGRENDAMMGLERADALRRIDSEHANLIEAVRWASANDELGQAAELAWRLCNYWSARGLWTDATGIWEDLKGLPDRYKPLRESWLGRFAFLRRDLDAAQGHLEAAIDGYRAAGDTFQVVQGVTMLATVHNARGDAALAAKLIEESLPMSRELGHPGMLCTALIGLGNIHYALRQLGPAAEALREALDVATAAGLENLINTATANLAGVAITDGDVRTARPLADSALAKANELGNMQDIGDWTEMVGICAASAGDLDTAQGYLGAALERVRAFGSPAQVAHVIDNLATAELDHGRADHAIALYREVLSLLEDEPTPTQEVRALIGLASALARDGQLDHAEANSRAALELALGLEHAALIAEARVIATELALVRGRTGSAAGLLEAALAGGQLFGPLVPRTWLAAAGLADETGAEEAAAALLGAAYARVERLGLAWTVTDRETIRRLGVEPSPKGALLDAAEANELALRTARMRAATPSGQPTRDAGVDVTSEA